MKVEFKDDGEGGILGRWTDYEEWFQLSWVRLSELEAMPGKHVIASQNMIRRALDEIDT